MHAGLCAVLTLASMSTSARCDNRAELFPAFPEAQGAGAYTPGGRGGKVLIVTTLADYDPRKQKPIKGSLRWAVSQKGPRTVLFRVAGNIELKRDLAVTEPFLTIAGQGAPGGGICLKDSSLEIHTHDVIVRYLRVRPGDTQQRELDAISCSGHNLIIDHCSASWAIDEVLSTNGNSASVTVGWCLITESLNRSFHHKGSHGYGSLISGPGEITYHHNVYAYHRSRNPRGGDVLLDFRNNLIFGWGDRAGYSGDDRLRMNYVANVLHPLPYSKSAAFAFLPGGMHQKIYIAKTRFDGLNEPAADDWRFIRPPQGATAAEARKALRADHPFPTSEVATDAADRAYRRILDDVGAILPVRDAVDARLIKQFRDSSGKIINSQSEVGGWPQLASGTPLPDGDNDGMPDAWETQHGLNPVQADRSSNDSDGDGFTDLEEYLNGTDPQAKDVWIYPPTVSPSPAAAFVGSAHVTLATKTPGAEIRYTLDDSAPSATSPRYEGPFEVSRSATLRTRAFLGTTPSHVRNVELQRLDVLQPIAVAKPAPMLNLDYYEIEGRGAAPNFSTLQATKTGEVPVPTLDVPDRREGGFAVHEYGLFNAPRAGIYRFYLRCVPHGRITLHGNVVVESSGRRREHSGAVALAKGLHPFAFQIYYDSDNNKTLEVSYEGPGIERQHVPANAFFHESN
jgi:pectate lyase